MHAIQELFAVRGVYADPSFFARVDENQVVVLGHRSSLMGSDARGLSFCFNWAREIGGKDADAWGSGADLRRTARLWAAARLGAAARLVIQAVTVGLGRRMGWVFLREGS